MSYKEQNAKSENISYVLKGIPLLLKAQTMLWTCVLIGRQISVCISLPVSVSHSWWEYKFVFFFVFFSFFSFYFSFFFLRLDYKFKFPQRINWSSESQRADVECLLVRWMCPSTEGFESHCFVSYLIKARGLTSLKRGSLVMLPRLVIVSEPKRWP